MSMTEQIESALNKIGVIFAAKNSRVTDLIRLSGGASQETWAFKISGDDGATARYVLRRAPGGQAIDRSQAAISLETEARLIDLAHSLGTPTPKVIHICTADDGLGDGFIMAFLDGETIARKILRDDAYAKARAQLAEACGKALANIHQLPLSETATMDLPQSDGLSQIAQYEEIYRSIDRPRPIIELAFQYLKKTVPAPSPNVLVHGDFRLGNLMVDQTGLAGVLDWELAHIGDPREDIGWICVNSWRFGQSAQRVGGFGQLEAFLSAYEAAGGPSFTAQQIGWWEMLGSLKWGIMCMMMYESFRTGATPTVERAAIGRRVSETEIDLLNLIEKAEVHA